MRVLFGFAIWTFIEKLCQSLIEAKEWEKQGGGKSPKREKYLICLQRLVRTPVLLGSGEEYGFYHSLANFFWKGSDENLGLCGPDTLTATLPRCPWRLRSSHRPRVKHEGRYMPIKLYFGTLDFQFYVIFRLSQNSILSIFFPAIKNYKNLSYLMR